MEFRLQRWSTDELRAENRACVFREADSETNIDRRHLTAERVNTRLPRREDCRLAKAARCAAVQVTSLLGLRAFPMDFSSLSSRFQKNGNTNCHWIAL